MKTLRLILGDQLSENISSLKECERHTDILLMCEVSAEATYVKHHQKKIAFLFSAMRHFAAELQAKGYELDYIKLSDSDNSHSFQTEVKRAINRHTPDKIVVTFPGEYRVWKDMESWEKSFGIPVEILEDDRFLCTRSEFALWAGDLEEIRFAVRQQLRMEFFYREMRKKYGILMNNNQPEGGKWNYDAQNRKKLPNTIKPPKPKSFPPDAITHKVIELVGEHFAAHFGDLEPFYFCRYPLASFVGFG